MKDLIYLNWASDLSPEPPNDKLRDEIEVFKCVQDQWAHKPEWAWDELWTALGRARRNLAPFLGVNSESEHFLFTTGTLHGLQILTSSFGIGNEPRLITPGMRVLTTDIEYGDIYRELDGRFDFEVVRLIDVEDEHDIVDRILRAALRYRPGMLLLSHVSLLNGLVLPIATIIRRIREELGEDAPMTVVDGAQAAGNVAVDLSEIAPDAYLGCFHKWLQGPNLTGWLYLRDIRHVQYLARRAIHVLSFDRKFLEGLDQPLATECSKIGLLVPQTAALGQHLEYLFYHGLYGSTDFPRKRAEELQGLLAGEKHTARHLMLPPDRLGSAIVALTLASADELGSLASFDRHRQRGVGLLRALHESRHDPGVAATAYFPRIPPAFAEKVKQPAVLRFSSADIWNTSEEIEHAARRVFKLWER